MKRNECSKQINARVMKWIEMSKNGLYSDIDLLAKRVRKGIPASIRQRIWPQLINIKKIKQKTPLTYSLVLLKDSYDTYDINLDVPRTFSFQSQQILRQSLFNVLKSLSSQFPKIGYCQGMNFLAMRLLEILDDDTTFYLLAFIIRKHKSFYDNFKNPGYVNKMSNVFTILLAKHLPKVYKKLKEQEISSLMYTPSWFITIFSKVLEREKFYRFFQCLIVFGQTIVYKTGLALMKLKQKQIVENNFEENLNFVTDAEYYKKFTDDEFIKTVFSFDIKLNEIKKLQQDYLEQNKETVKRLQEDVKKAYEKKKEEPRKVTEWDIQDFKKSEFHYVNFQ